MEILMNKYTQKYQSEVERGESASRILNDPLFQEAWDKMEKGLIDHLKSTMARDTEIREKIWVAMGILDKLRSTFNETLNTGKLARKTLDKITRK